MHSYSVCVHFLFFFKVTLPHVYSWNCSSDDRLVRVSDHIGREGKNNIVRVMLHLSGNCTGIY